MLTSNDLAELERCAGALDSDNHHRFLSELLACLRQHRDPVMAYELIEKIQSSARDKEAMALNAVRSWLDVQLSKPEVRSVEDLELRLVWTRRIARIIKSRPKANNGDSSPAPVHSSPCDKKLLRRKYPPPPPSPPRPLPPLFRANPAKEPVQPEAAPLPDELEVLFANHRDAVTSLKQVARTPASAQSGPSRRSGRELLLAASRGAFPADIHAVSLLVTSATVWLTSYLKELNGPRNGAAFPFRVTRLQRQGTRVVAHEILLDASGHLEKESS
jgi:hypothetical protein